MSGANDDLAWTGGADERLPAESSTAADKARRKARKKARKRAKRRRQLTLLAVFWVELPKGLDCFLDSDNFDVGSDRHYLWLSFITCRMVFRSFIVKSRSGGQKPVCTSTMANALPTDPLG